MGREVAEQATKRRGRVRRFMTWLGYGPETEQADRPDRDARRAKGKAEAAERRARRRAERLARKQARQAAAEEAKPAEAVAAEASSARRETQAAATGPRELEERLAEMESRARSAEQRAEEARARFAEAEAIADWARAAAKEARHGIGAISTKLARAEAERRLHEQAERRLESRCSELRGELELERKEKAAILEHFDRRLAAIEDTAEAAAKRLAAAERELIKGSNRSLFDGSGRAERVDLVRHGDPLEALETSIGKDTPRRDGRTRERDRPRGEAREPSRTA